jgi:signal transduction histidine kinase
VGGYVQSFGTEVDFVAGELDAPRLAPLAAATMYRILQETLTNVARHARATKVSVELTRDESALALVVRDDGVGFDVSRAHNAVSGLGLHGMRERVTLLGGSIQIESRLGEGTVVRARIPAGSASPSRQSTTGAPPRKRLREKSKR